MNAPQIPYLLHGIFPDYGNNAEAAFGQTPALQSILAPRGYDHGAYERALDLYNRLWRKRAPKHTMSLAMDLVGALHPCNWMFEGEAEQAYR